MYVNTVSFTIQSFGERRGVVLFRTAKCRLGNPFIIRWNRPERKRLIFLVLYYLLKLNKSRMGITFQKRVWRIQSSIMETYDLKLTWSPCTMSSTFFEVKTVCGWTWLHKKHVELDFWFRPIFWRNENSPMKVSYRVRVDFYIDCIVGVSWIPFIETMHMLGSSPALTKEYWTKARTCTDVVQLSWYSNTVDCEHEVNEKKAKTGRKPKRYATTCQ